MTDIRPSPEMLDAIAANRAAPLEERNLIAAIADHRLLYRSETGILKLHQRGGEPEGEHKALKMKLVRKDGPKCSLDRHGWTGLPFSRPFAAFLDEQYGAFPWSKALLYLRWNVCRRTHTEHWERPEWKGSLCYELVSFVIRRETSLDYARLQLGLPEEGKTRRTLDSALLVIERRLEVLLADDKARQSLPARTPSEWMAGEHHHRPLDGLHRVECPQCAHAA